MKKGQKMTREQKIKIGLANSISLKGKKHSKETKIKIKKSMIGKNTWMKGKKHSLLSKTKMSFIKIGKKKSKQQRKNIGLAKIGEKNPNWQGGKSFEPYTIDWTNTLKRSIRERDHYTCQLCGNIQEENTLCVHHIDYNKTNCNPKNLITLCRICHNKTNLNREYWTNYFQKL